MSFVTAATSFHFCAMPAPAAYLTFLFYNVHNWKRKKKTNEYKRTRQFFLDAVLGATRFSLPHTPAAGTQSVEPGDELVSCLLSCFFLLFLLKTRTNTRKKKKRMGLKKKHVVCRSDTGNSHVREGQAKFTTGSTYSQLIDGNLGSVCGQLFRTPLEKNKF